MLEDGEWLVGDDRLDDGSAVLLGQLGGSRRAHLAARNQNIG
ncbi:hypothetical protein AB0M29_41735 [Streptomyces sp. NPDC051976]